MKVKNVFFIALCWFIKASALNFKQIVVYGKHPTHKYIHEAYVKTCKFLGYKVLYLSDADNIDDIDFSQTLFITTGEDSPPLREDCFYILQYPYNEKNMERLEEKKEMFWSEKYQEKVPKNHILHTAPYYSNLSYKNYEKLAPYTMFSLEEQALFIPWATDLLPHEIEKQKAIVKQKKYQTPLKRNLVFVGTIWGSSWGNLPEMHFLDIVCNKHKLQCEKMSHLSFEENKRIISQAFIAPAIQCVKQVEIGYIPCRILKNISYGAMGITNNPLVYELFGKKIIYEKNLNNLIEKAVYWADHPSWDVVLDLMDFVKTNHTYVHRIQTYLNVLENIIQKTTKMLQ